MLRIAANAGNGTILGFNKNTAADTAVATSRFDFVFHSIPSDLATTTATPMPPIKINHLQKKKGTPSMEMPFFGAYTVAVVPI
jgi:hypothetical protein